MQASETRSKQDQLNRGIHDTRMRLLSEFRDRVHPEVIERAVDETFETLKDAPVSEFVPLFVYRSAKEQLTNLSRSLNA